MFGETLIRGIGTCLFVWSTVWAVDVAIDPSTRYQTMLGFGGHDISNVGEMVDDLGLSVVRVEIKHGGGAMPDWNTLQNLRIAGVKTFIATPWSPPPQWKWCTSAGCEDRLWNRLSNGLGPESDFVTGLQGEPGGEPNRYPEFADWMANWVEEFKTRVGIDLYAISPQNEPDFAQFYASCVYSAGQMRDVIQHIGKEMEDRGLWPTTKINMAERMLADFMGAISPYSTEIVVMNDATASKYVDAVSVHGYADGVSPMESTNAERFWSGAATFCDRANGPLARSRGGKKMGLWMTETSGYLDWSGGSCGPCGTENNPGAQKLGLDMYTALKHGKISLWTWWRMQVTSAGWLDETLVFNGEKKKTYYVSKQYYKFIRPGAVMINADDTGDDRLGVVAFHHPENNTLALVLSNTNASNTSITLTGTDLPSSYERYVTTETKNCEKESNVSGQTFDVPGNSFVTLVGSGYTPNITVGTRGNTRTSSVSIAAVLDNADISAFTVDGRHVAKLKNTTLSGNLPAGTYLLKYTDPSSGKLLAQKSRTVQ